MKNKSSKVNEFYRPISYNESHTKKSANLFVLCLLKQRRWHLTLVFIGHNKLSAFNLNVIFLTFLRHLTYFKRCNDIIDMELAELTVANARLNMLLCECK